MIIAHNIRRKNLPEIDGMNQKIVLDVLIIIPVYETIIKKREIRNERNQKDNENRKIIEGGG